MARRPLESVGRYWTEGHRWPEPGEPGQRAAEEPNVVDLMDALRRSAEEMRRRRGKAAPGESRSKGQPKNRASAGSRARTAKGSSKAAAK